MTDIAERASSFGSVAEAYDRFRPGPPLSAVDWILDVPRGSAADLGAGTGALTRQMACRVDTVFALEPDPRMLEVLTRRSPEVSAVRCTAEQLPMGPGTLDAAMVSSAWHWMDPGATIAELGRVLRPGGVFGVIWNGADRSVDWVTGLLGDPGPFPPVTGSGRRAVISSNCPPGSPFVDLDSCVIHWSLPLDREQLVGLAGTYSSMITMPPGQRDAELSRIRPAAADVAADGSVELPMSCRCWRAVRS